jgi:hypothetical protein
MLLWLFLLLSLDPGAARAGDKPFWRSCAEAFRIGRPAPALKPGLAELDTLLKEPKFREKFRDPGDEHRLTLKNGKGRLKIGIWNRDQRRFTALVLKAVREGSLGEIDAGEVVGPKVLLLLDHLRVLGEKEGWSLEVKGRFNLAFLRDRADTQQFLNLPSTSAQSWSDAERRAFTAAIENLRLEDCEARGLGGFVLVTRPSEPAQFRCH